MASLAHPDDRHRRRKREERQAPTSQQTPAASSSTSGPSLVVTGKFVNDLPLPPVPKLLRALPSRRRLSKYSATSLELDDRPWVLLERDPEARLDLVNVSLFGSLPEIGAMQPPLAKEDQKLVSDYDLSDSVFEANKKKRRLEETTEAFHREAFGLQLPQLLSNDVFTERQRYTTGPDSAEKKLSRNPPERLDDEELTVRVEKTFEDAVVEPVHPTNPALKPKRILPLVPDAMVWGNKYRQVVFDELPDKPKRDDLLFMSIPNPRVTCFGYFSSPSEDGLGGNTYRLSQNYVWENRGGYAKQAAIGEGEALMMSCPVGDEQGEARFVLVPPWTRLKKQKAFRLDLQLPTQILNVSHRDPNMEETEEEQRRIGVVLRDEVSIQSETSDVAWVGGQWVVRSSKVASSKDNFSNDAGSQAGDAASSHPTPPASPQSDL